MRASDLFGGLAGRTLLCLGAHADDIEIGCGGTLRRLLQRERELAVHWVVLSAAGEREHEARASAEALLADVAHKRIVTAAFRDGFFPYVGGEIKELFERLKTECDPALVFTHRTRDLHQDHRLIAELTWNTFRNHLILEYEVPKYDGDLGAPNVFVELHEDELAEKARFLERHFASQRDKSWFSEQTFKAVGRLRGIECNASTGYAEAFHARKLRVALD